MPTHTPPDPDRCCCCDDAADGPLEFEFTIVFGDCDSLPPAVEPKSPDLVAPAAAVEVKPL